MKALEWSQHYQSTFKMLKGSYSVIGDGMTEFKLIQAFTVVLLICKNEYDPFKIDSTRVVTAFLPLLVNGDFSRDLSVANS